MPVDVALALPEIQRLLAPKPRRVSQAPPEADVEIVPDPQDPAGRFAAFRVRGFDEGTDPELREPFAAAVQARMKIAALEGELRRELNPAGDQDPAGEVFAESQARARLGKWRQRADAAVVDAARAICRFGVLSWPEGSLTAKGNPVGYATAPAEILGKTREGLTEEILDFLVAAGLVSDLALACLIVSAGGQWPSAEVQLAVARAGADAAKEGAAAPPFGQEGPP